MLLPIFHQCSVILSHAAAVQTRRLVWRWVCRLQVLVSCSSVGNLTLTQRLKSQSIDLGTRQFYLGKQSFDMGKQPFDLQISYWSWGNSPLIQINSPLVQRNSSWIWTQNSFDVEKKYSSSMQRVVILVTTVLSRQKKNGLLLSAVLFLPHAGVLPEASREGYRPLQGRCDMTLNFMLHTYNIKQY